VFGLAYDVLGDATLAEDVAQQTFEHAWRHASTYDPRRGTVHGWMLRIAHNAAVDVVRMRRPTPIDPDELSLLVAAMTRTPEHVVLAGESLTQLRLALAGLPAEQARAVVMAAVHGMTAQQISDAEAIPLGTTKSRIRVGLTKLHETLPKPRDDHG
jgi:RNA polymerase sigma-70 factor (ECF subfamily)